MKQFIFLFLVVTLISSCSEYQKVLNKGTAEDQYKMATELYETEKYNKSIVLFEKIIPKYQRKPQLERIQFMVAESNYKTKSYELAAYYFNRFIGNYPASSKLEEAAYLAAHSYYLASPKPSRDQADTQKALISFQNFIDKYPESSRLAEANKLYDELSERVEKKAFDNAKLYYKLGSYNLQNYQAAIIALDTFLEEHIGTKFKEEALAYKFMSAYEIGVKSIFSKKQKRLEEALVSYNRFQKSFPESIRLKEFESLVATLNKEIKETKELQDKTDTNGL